MKKILFLLLIIFNYSFSKIVVKEINKEYIPRIKYSVDLSVWKNSKELPSKDELLEIAEEYMDKNKDYERYFITFYLPKMEINKGAFATYIKETKINKEINYHLDSIYYNKNNMREYGKYLEIDEKGNYRIKKLEGKTDDLVNKIPKFEDELYIDVSNMLENGKLKIIVNSNLPDGMELGVELSHADYIAQSNIVIDKDGNGESELFSNNNYRLRSGVYNLEVFSISALVQDEKVKKIIGENGENLKGKNIIIDKDSFNPGEKLIKIKKKIKI